MGWPEFIYLTLVILGLFITTFSKTQPLVNKVVYYIGVTITLSLLYWGGFFV